MPRMSFGRRAHGGIATSMLAIAITLPTAAPARFLEPTVLSTDGSGGRDINSRGVAVGVSTSPTTGLSVATRWQNGVRTQLGVLDTTESSAAYAINDHGTIVGDSSHVLGRPYQYFSFAARWTDAGIERLPSLDGRFAIAWDVTNSGVVVGEAQSLTATGVRQNAVLWRDGGIEVLETRLPTDSGWVLATADAINEAEQVVGRGVFQGRSVGYFLDGTTVTVIPPVPPASTCTPTDVNEFGQVVGACGDRAFLWAQGEDTQDLGPVVLVPGGAEPRINDRGIVIGPGFVWRDGRRSDINSLVAPQSAPNVGWHLTSAVAITNAGIVAGGGTLNGVPRQFLLDLFGCADTDGDLDPDDDGDGLCDNWETEGIDGDFDGTPDLLLYDLDGDGVVGPDETADPNHKDLYVEVDYMQFHRPTPAALGRVIDAFAKAPVDNPDGTTGIRLHVVPGDLVFHWDVLAELHDVGGTVPDFHDLKANLFGTEAERTHANASTILDAKRQAFRYAISAHAMKGKPVGGQGEIGGNDFLLTLGAWGIGGIEKTIKPDTEASTFMHELGHTLGRRHGGGDNVNCKPNYLSVMNYSLTFDGVPVVGRKLDYSSSVLPTLDERDLDEAAGVAGPVGTFTAFRAPGDAEISIAIPASGPIDWNTNFVATDTHVAADLNVGCDYTEDPVLKGADDWRSLVYSFRESEYLDDALPPRDADIPLEPTFDEVLAASPDTDADGVRNLVDNCIVQANAEQGDTDADRVGDPCDNCPLAANGDQADGDGDGVGDACEGGPVCGAEVCDGLDNDCNGAVDDGFGTLACGLGACTRIADACANGAPGVCTPGTPEGEACDARDADCDGLVDAADPDCHRCGDGDVDPGETCDDGGTIDGDGCSATCEVDPPVPTISRDLALTRVGVPRTVALADTPIVRTVKVQIQNRSPRDETIADGGVLLNLVRLDARPIDPSHCPAPTVALSAKQAKLPKTLKPKQKLAIAFDVTIDCVLDPAKSSKKDPGHEDYRFTATVERAALDGQPDTHPDDDVCPRSPLGLDVLPDGKLQDRGCVVALIDVVIDD